MQKWEKRLRDVEFDGEQAYHYQGFDFPKYEGKLTQDEHNSRQNFYAFWGDFYLTAAAIRYHVGLLIENRKILKIAA